MFFLAAPAWSRHGSYTQTGRVDGNCTGRQTECGVTDRVNLALLDRVSSFMDTNLFDIKFARICKHPKVTDCPSRACNRTSASSPWDVQADRKVEFFGDRPPVGGGCRTLPFSGVQLANRALHGQCGGLCSRRGKGGHWRA